MMNRTWQGVMALGLLVTLVACAPSATPPQESPAPTPSPAPSPSPS